MLKIKRAYDPAARSDGRRILVDRLWPRGITKAELAAEAWFKEIAPSNELRKEFGHDPEHWEEFRTAYKRELNNPQAKEMLRELARLARIGNVTLLYGAKDTEHNNAVVLKELIGRRKAG